ncbi:glycoside hydrolase family 3 N-terminal domain-containing protein [Halobellus rarus]|uniref:Glycoside hydrolase family 3 N-terminal domain-containing protein n=1 Tax=Halobellus rarus TaxID=1126237 RepID=A0ABD6CQE8_9EURY|nr:glycoside hydrolase family 3 N-terminal domain-containing protein [Halobellus rarus]
MTAATYMGRLVDEMSPETKVAQLGTVRIGSLLEDGRFSPERAREEIPHGIGRVTRVGRESGLPPEALAGVVADIQSFLRTETPYGVPAFVREESLCGYAGRRGAVVPQAIGMASTWDTPLVREVAAAVGEQLRAVGCQLTLSPVADLGVEPRWGRTEETFGEDPALAAALTERAVAGFLDAGVEPTLKHFVGHGRPAGGRNRGRPTASLREMRDADLIPFRAGIDAGASSVMAAYNTVDGVPCHANHRLLTDLLREEWGFTGTVVSDGRGIELLATEYGVAPDKRTAGVLALSAGVDVELPETECFGDRLVAAVSDGDVDESLVDRAVRRHLWQKVRAGLFTDPLPDPGATAEAFGPNSVRPLARRAARRSQVILTNDGVLPLAPDAAVAVVGPNADAPRNMLGNYSYAGAEGDDGHIAVSTPRESLSERISTVEYARGCGVREGPTDDIDEAVALAADADVVVACLGGQSGIDVERDSSGTTGEGLDRATLGLPGRQSELLDGVASTGTPVVVVLVSGRPLAVPETVERANAVVAAWLPGQEGGSAIADVLLGTDPGGRLPVSLPRSVGQLPSHYRQSPVSTGEYVFSRAEPLFPFGHGESYAEFVYDDFAVAPESAATDGTLTASLAVENVAPRSGTEVVQLYARHRGGRSVRPDRELVGFRRVSLGSHDRVQIDFTLPAAALATYGPADRLVVEPGTVELAVARSAVDLRGRGTVELVGDPHAPEDRPPVAETAVRSA